MYKMRMLALFLLAGFLPANVYAAPAMTSHVCSVKAVVEKIEKREEKYEPESWRKAWGLPESQVYWDITLSVKDADLIEEHMTGDCTKEGLPKVFQLRDRNFIGLLKKPAVGSCINARTQFSGDEFSIGQWLDDIETLPTSECE